jgi:hypothetical protein
MSTPKKPETETAAAAPVYVVARGVLSNGKDPKTKQRLSLKPGDEFKPAADDDVEGLLKSGIIMTQAEFAKHTSPLAADLIAEANRRAEAAEKKVAELQAAAKPAT